MRRLDRATANDMNPLPDLPNLSVVSQAIQLSIAPVFLLAGIGAFLNACVSRLARIVDRARAVETLVLDAPAGAEHDRHVWEINRLDRRMRIVNRAIFLSVASAVAVCGVVCLMFLAVLIKPPLGPAIAALFIVTMLLVTAGFATFLQEVRLAAKTIRVRSEILEHRLDIED